MILVNVFAVDSFAAKSVLHCWKTKIKTFFPIILLFSGDFKTKFHFFSFVNKGVKSVFEFS